MDTPRHGPALREVWMVWALYVLDAAAIFATYARLPVHELYHVSENGRAGGTGRVVVFLNFPVALVAIALVAVVAAEARSRAVNRLALVAFVLCAVVVWPGVVAEADLDAKWINTVAAAGVALAFALTLIVTRRGGLGPRARLRGDRVRVAAALLLAVVALPWVAADLGFLIGRWPVFGSIFYSDEWYAPFGHARLNYAVHTGHHHGMDGTLLALTAILLSRTLGRVGPRLRGVLGAYLALMLVYGLGNVANDFWYEQLVKRGVTDWAIPNVIVPGPNIPWLVLVVLAAVAYVVLFRRISPAQPTGHRRLVWPATLLLPVAALLLIGLLHGRHRHVTPLGSADGIALAVSPAGTWHLFVTRRGELVQLTGGDHSELSPKWAPDGRSMAFQSNRDGNWEIYVANSDGANVRRLTDADAQDGEPAWSPDGKRIAFVRNDDVYVVQARGGPAKEVADDASRPAWSSDGKFLALELGAGTRHMIEVRRGNGEASGFFGTVDSRYPAWSPQGDLLAYECLHGEHWHICLSDLRSGALVSGAHRVLTRGKSDDLAPAWSPDGSRIAFISDRDGPDQLFVMRADGTSVLRLTSGMAEKDTPTWR